MRKTLYSLVCSLLLTFMLSGCGIIDYIYMPPPSDTAQELYENGNEAMRDKLYVTAAEYYTKLKDNYPFSPYAIEAELALGDALFLDTNYTAAAEAYKDFESLHPRNEAMPYVLYQVAMSDFNSFVSIDRPVTMIQEAFEYFQRLQATYPESEYALKAAEYMQKCRVVLAERELYIADVFWRTEKYNSAWQRYTFVVENFQDVPKAVEYADEKASAAYIRYREQEAQNVLDTREGTWRDWFRWL